MPINTKVEKIAGLKTYKNVSEMSEKPSIINFVVPPEVGLKITKDLVGDGYNNYWYQPGAESQKISNYLKSKNRNFIDDKCIMVVTRLQDNY